MKKKILKVKNRNNPTKQGENKLLTRAESLEDMKHLAKEIYQKAKKETYNDVPNETKHRL